MDKRLSVLQTGKGILGMLLAGVMLLTLIWILLVCNSTGIKKIDGGLYEVKNLNEGYVLCLDNVQHEYEDTPLVNDSLRISGWMIKPGEDTNSVRMRIVLRDDDTGEYLVLPTALLQRPDVTANYDDGHNYDVSGFEVKISPRKIDLENSKYMLMMLYFLNGEEFLIELNQAIE